MKTYQLHILLDKPLKKQIGKLGKFKFPKGHYIYTGSAKTNIDARIKRHKVKDKKLFWHIDYLLADLAAQVISVKKSNKDECLWNQNLNGKIMAHGFGSSDCSKGCKSHLNYMGEKYDWN